MAFNCVLESKVSTPKVFRCNITDKIYKMKTVDIRWEMLTIRFVASFLTQMVQSNE